MNKLEKVKQYLDKQSVFEVSLIELLTELFESSSQSSDYKKFVFNFNQVGTDNPTIVSIVNELGSFTFVRVSTGVFRLTMTGVFLSNKLIIDGLTYHYNVLNSNSNGPVYITRENSNSLLFSFVNDGITDFNYELKVYN